MNYIVFDLEFNQEYSPVKTNKNTKCPFEIIQIGAVKLDRELKTIATLDILVKPEIYPILNPFVQEMTSITIDQLSKAKPFTEVYKEFLEFVRGQDNALCTWGIVDIKELFRNLEYYDLNTFLIPRNYINLQLYASRYLGCPKGISIGLKKAVELLEISFDDGFHNAYYDAYYTSEIYKKIYNKNIKTNIYKSHKDIKLDRHENSKKKIDTYKLIKQFEKMFNREMTLEEQKIIKLAYMMGKTNQFQIKNGENEVK
ncbi:3'-5' exonuclease [Clostridium sp. OS1-26]|uniref:3'-5' exonuclease n=1 Tax=Clostridium sp. OS1-26 TaxID=3070681 RepID=UPI0027DF180F|nr:3'-5' exonuclease [Clostridium sp. OS1-26]WML34117.1 3'-5' exonuclease [Clostridium sp. OS1-26]